MSPTPHSHTITDMPWHAAHYSTAVHAYARTHARTNERTGALLGATEGSAALLVRHDLAVEVLALLLQVLAVPLLDALLLLLLFQPEILLLLIKPLLLHLQLGSRDEGGRRRRGTGNGCAGYAGVRLWWHDAWR
jgi:hypothetical protein